MPGVEDPRGDAFSYLVRPIGALLRCSLLGLSMGLTAEAFLGWRINGFRIAYGTTGVTLITRILVDSDTIRNWADWLTELRFAREITNQQWERQRMAWQQTETAAQAVQMVNSQPSAEDGLVNETIARLLRDYFSAKAAGERPDAKLWSRRSLEKRYNLGQFTRANERVREILAEHSEGNHLKARTYRSAFWLIFGADPADWRDVQLVRIADNPATGDPVFARRQRLP